jgi:nicotinamide riboside transporter PnuC
MLDNVCQAVICTLSIAAIFLVSRKNKWGFVLGLVSQPFWLITTYQHKQWGIFFLSLVYAFNWAYGIYNWFYKKEPKT